MDVPVWEFFSREHQAVRLWQVSKRTGIDDLEARVEAHRRGEPAPQAIFHDRNRISPFEQRKGQGVRYMGKLTQTFGRKKKETQGTCIFTTYLVHLHPRSGNRIVFALLRLDPD